MRGFEFVGYGGPEKMRLSEVPPPSVGPTDVLVRVQAAGINPVDFRIREGAMRSFDHRSFPFVAGGEIAGTVESIGSSVEGFTLGETVFARLNKSLLGGLAEFVAVDQSLLAHIPANLSFPEAAGVPLAGLTALQMLRDELKITPGYRLYIVGGAGGVGTFAIQIAKHLGAYVATTASPSGLALVTSLGADEVVDYTTTNVTDVLHGFDGALDLRGGNDLVAAMRVVKAGGAIVSVAGIPEPQTARVDLNRKGLLPLIFWFASRKVRRAAKLRGVSYRRPFMRPSGADLTDLATMIEEGSVRVIVEATYPLHEAAAAFAHLERGHAKGKIIVTLEPEG